MNIRDLVTKFEKAEVLNNEEIKNLYNHYKQLEVLVFENPYLKVVAPFVVSNKNKLLDILSARGCKID